MSARKVLALALQHDDFYARIVLRLIEGILNIFCHGACHRIAVSWPANRYIRDGLFHAELDERWHLECFF